MKYGCIGEHLGHSFSKEIHKELADYEYEICEVAREELPRFMTEHDFIAINVTIPYKEAVIPYLDVISDRAAEIGAVNTIVNRDGKLYGYNTDFFGMASLIKKCGIDVAGKKVLVLGTGGTSRTAVAVAKALGASEVYRVSRTAKDGAVSYEDVYELHSDAEIIINTTPVGMFPKADASAVELDRFPSVKGVVDAVYNPLRTKLYQDACRLNIPCTCGLYMLVAQAAEGCGKFIGAEISDERTTEIYEKLFKEKENIVLTGMPGAGKSTIGQMLAKRLGRKFVDTDDEITRLTGKTPAQIIESEGEAKFRDIESQVIAEAVAPLTSCVIATGGGAVLREENVTRLKRNGKIIWIDRDPEFISATSDRPLSSNRELLMKRYEERYPIYTATCDGRIAAVYDVEANVEAVLSIF